MKEASLISQRFHLRSYDSKSETLVVTKEFLKSVRTARIRDDVYLGNQKKGKFE